MSTIQQFLSPNFIGLDLHSDNVQICVMKTILDEHGQLSQKILLNRKVSLKEGPTLFLKTIEPFCQDVKHIAAVESTYNWYWMADEFEKRGWRLVLADPSTVSEDKKKATNDRTDAEFIADRLRHNNLNYTEILDSTTRSMRDLIRHRMEVVQERASRKIILINLFTNQLCTRLRSSDLNLLCKLYEESVSNPEKQDCLKRHLEEKGLCQPAQLIKIIAIVKELVFFNGEVEEIEAAIKELLKSHSGHEAVQLAGRLRTIKGCGFILSNVIAFEIGTFSRFKKSGEFSSYCRLAPTSKLSNGSSKGMGNAKNGNAYLSWAFTELANLTARYNGEVKRYYDRMFSRQKLRVKAIRTVAAKLTRAVWHMLRSNEEFDVKRCFG